MQILNNGDLTYWSIPQTLGDLTGTVSSAQLQNGLTFVAPNLGTPASGILTNCTFPTLNQNTTGTAAGLSSTLAIPSGGTGATTSAAALTALGAAPTASPTFTGTVNAAAITASGLTTTATLATTGLCTKYDNVNTTGQGLPSLVGVVTTGTHTAAIAATSLLAAPVAGGFYRISAYMKITVATTTPVAGPITITYKDNDGVSQSVVMMLQNATGAVATSTGSTTTTPVMGTIEIYCGSGTAIQYAVAFSGTGTYELVLKCESF